MRIAGRPPGFFVSVAFKGFSGGVSCLDATVADGCVGVDSKGDVSGLGWAPNGSVEARGQVDFNAEDTEFAEAEGIEKDRIPPTPGYTGSCELSV